VWVLEGSVLLENALLVKANNADKQITLIAGISLLLLKAGTYRPRDSQTEGQTEKDTQTDRQTGHQTIKQTDRQICRQIDRQTDRQTYGQTDRQTGRTAD